MAIAKPKDSEQQPVDRLRAVLGAMNLRQAVFVDDEFSVDFDTVWARSVAVERDNRTNLRAAWGTGDWENDSVDDDREAAEAAWKGMAPPQRSDLWNKVTSLAGLQSGEVTFLGDNWPNDACPMTEIGPEAFTDSYIGSLLAQEAGSIVFIDLVLGESSPEGGVDLLKSVLRRDTGKKAVCVILTGVPSADNPDYWAELSDRAGLDSLSAVVISKKSTVDPVAFENDLRRALLNGLSPELMRWARTIAQGAIQKATEKAAFEGDVLNAVVLQSSWREGVQPTETLFRLVDEEYRRERTGMILSAEAKAGFASLKTKLEALSKIGGKEESTPPLSLRVRLLMRRHLYRNDAEGDWPMPIWLGDIWRATLSEMNGEETKEWEEHFVLLAQPCDVILRTKDGTRSQEWVVLVPVLREGKDQESMVRLAYFGEPKCADHWAHLKKARVANANVLDLVALSGSKIQKNEVARLKEKSHIQPSVEIRLQILSSWAQKAISSPAAHLELALFSGPGPVAKLTVSEETVDFHLTRIARIEPDLAQLLLHRYGNFMSRHALPHDFAQQGS